MELGVRGLGLAPLPPHCCVTWVGPLPSLGLGFLLVSWSPPAICRWAVPGTSHSGEQTLSP